MTPAMEWDAAAYHQVADPQFRWGLRVLARLPLTGRETVLDAGCGSGRLTAELLGRLPEGRVIAVDASRAMLDQARKTLEPLAHGRVEYVEADLARLDLEATADAVFSAATFHWVADHDALFAGLFRALRPGGRLVAQCGGPGNLDRLRKRARTLMAAPRFSPSFAGFTESWHYAGATQTAERLERAGFHAVRVWVEESPTPFAGAQAFRRFITTVVARPYLGFLRHDADRRAFEDALVASAAADDPPFTLDYRRLNLDAMKPA